MKPLFFHSEIIQRYHEQRTAVRSSSKGSFVNGIRKCIRELSLPFRCGGKLPGTSESTVCLMETFDSKQSNHQQCGEGEVATSEKNSASGSRYQYTQKVKTKNWNTKPTIKNMSHKIPQMIFEKGYQIGQEIGNGSYAKVRIVKRIQDGRILAAKIVDRTKGGNCSDKFLSKEIAAGLRLNHPNIIKYWEVIILHGWTFIIMDYAELGDLLEFIRENGAFRNQDAKIAFGQIVSAVQYLHRQGFVHRDLKCENILLRREMSILLSDFGFAREINTVGGTISKTFCGSAAYASPELLCGFPYDPILNDIWSLGCVLFILVCGIMPFDESDLKVMIKKQKAHSITVPIDNKSTANQNCQDLIRRLLNPDPMERPKLDDIICSDWLKYMIQGNISPMNRIECLSMPVSESIS